MDFASWISLTLLCIAGASSPGPSLFVITDISRRSGQLAGLVSSFGHGVGIFLYALAAATGLAIIARGYPSLFAFTQCLGALFLLWLAYKLLANSTKPRIENKEKTQHTLLKALYSGFIIAILNPKVAIFFTSIFGAFILPDQSLNLHASMAAAAGIIDGLIYMTYVKLLSFSVIKQFFSSNQKTLDRTLAFLFIAFAVGLAFEVLA